MAVEEERRDRKRFAAREQLWEETIPNNPKRSYNGTALTDFVSIVSAVKPLRLIGRDPEKAGGGSIPSLANTF